MSTQYIECPLCRHWLFNTNGFNDTSKIECDDCGCAIGIIEEEPIMISWPKDTQNNINDKKIGYSYETFTVNPL